MNLIQYAEAAITAELQEHTFDLNVLIENQIAEGSKERFLKVLDDYARCASKMEVLKKIKEQMQESFNQGQNPQPIPTREYPDGVPPNGWENIPDDVRATFEKYQGKFEKGEDFTEEFINNANKTNTNSG